MAHLKITLGTVEKHERNDEFCKRVASERASVVCIDGPCSTNGLRCRADWSFWNDAEQGDIRDGERSLAQEGIGLFWTTFTTVMGFDEASRWIARSLRIFHDLPRLAPKCEAIETHPNAAFTVMWRAFGQTGTLPKKTTAAGRDVRLAVLRSFIAGLSADTLRDHEEVDAACAALVAALHALKITRPYGTCAGVIWVPDTAMSISVCLPIPRREWAVGAGRRRRIFENLAVSVGSHSTRRFRTAKPHR
jgi:hypothetical protein